ncbi:MAG TPA: helix-turn-helix domain-containing protein [Candidatus Hodarchaeales archaeon]|nr:helix-turn-helix domain-containing protein [Candidatus Hodarchaeales archaeon]
MQITKIAYSKKQAAAGTSLSVRMLDYLIKRGDLKARKIGRRVVIPGTELTRLIGRVIKGNPSTLESVEVANDRTS